MNVDPIGNTNNVIGPSGIDRTVGKQPERNGDSPTVQADTSSTLEPSDLRSYLAVGHSVSPQREARIQALRDAIQQGTYQVPINTLAQKLLGNGSGR